MTQTTPHGRLRDAGHRATGWTLGRKIALGVSVALTAAIGTTAAAAVWWSTRNLEARTAAAALATTATLAAQLEAAGTVSAANSIATLDTVTDNQVRAVAAAMAFLVDAAESAGHGAAYIDDTLRQITARSATERIDVLDGDAATLYSSDRGRVTPEDLDPLLPAVSGAARGGTTAATPTVVDAGGLVKRAAAQLTERDGAVVVAVRLDMAEAQAAYGAADTAAARGLAGTHAGSIALTVAHAVELAEDAGWTPTRIGGRLETVVRNTSITAIRLIGGAATTVFHAGTRNAPEPAPARLDGLLAATATTTTELGGFYDPERRWVVRTGGHRTPRRLAAVVDLATQTAGGTLVDSARQALLDRFADLEGIEGVWIAAYRDGSAAELAAAAPRPGSGTDAWERWTGRFAAAGQTAVETGAATAEADVRLWPAPEARIVAAHPLDPTSALVVDWNATVGLAAMRNELAGGLAGAAALIIVMTAATTLLARTSISTPLGRVTAATAELANGRMPRPAPALARRGDELGALTRNFENMAREILARHDELTGLVAARTADLKTALDQIRRDVALAQTVQRAMTRPTSSELGQLRVETRIAPAAELAGDFTITRMSADQATVGVFDVAGKGVAAALFMVAARAALNEALDKTDPAALDEAVARANEALSSRNEAGMFVTGFIATIDPRSGEMRYVCAGHEPPILATRRGCRKLTNTGGIPLGLDAARSFTLGRGRMAPGDTLVVYTDGVTDACNPGGDEFREARLERAVRGQRNTGAADVLNAIWSAVERFTGDAPPVDDMTCAVVTLQAPRPT